MSSFYPSSVSSGAELVTSLGEGWKGLHWTLLGHQGAWGVGVAGSGPLPGHHQPRQGQKGFRRSSSQPGGPCLSRCGRNAAGWPLGLSLLVVVGRLTGSGQAHTPLGFKSACDSERGVHTGSGSRGSRRNPSPQGTPAQDTQIEAL